MQKFLIFNDPQARYNTFYIRKVQIDAEPELGPDQSRFHCHAVLHINSYVTIKKQGVLPHMIEHVQNIVTKWFKGLIGKSGRSAVRIERCASLSNLYNYIHKMGLTKPG